MGLFSSKSEKKKNTSIPEPKAEAPKSPRELIAEKYRKLNERSQFIQEEIKRVKQFKKEFDAKYLKDK